MRSSWKLARIAGIDVYVHATFVMLLAWVAYMHWRAGGTAGAALAGVVFVVAVFGTIVLHELGHALTARRFGIRTRDITLWPIGGVARLERMPEKPGQELLVAVAGPAVNLAIALALGVAIFVMGSPLFPEGLLGGGLGALLTRLLWVNVTIAVFNLLPAFPMDGGRALRALLALRGDYVNATRIAAGIGQAFALLFGLLGLFANPLLIFIALFLWMGAAAESGAAQTKGALAGVPVHAAMQTHFRAMTAAESLADAARELLSGSQTEFPVLDDEGRVVGVVTRPALIEGLTALGPEGSLARVMVRRFAVADPYEPLDRVLSRMEEAACSLAPVVQGERLVGLVTRENIMELLLVRDAMRAQHTQMLPLEDADPRAA